MSRRNYSAPSGRKNPGGNVVAVNGSACLHRNANGGKWKLDLVGRKKDLAERWRAGRPTSDDIKAAVAVSRNNRKVPITLAHVPSLEDEQ